MIKKISDLARTLYEGIIQTTDTLVFPETFYRGGGTPKGHESAVFVYLSGTKLHEGLNSYCLTGTIVGKNIYKIEKEIKTLQKNERLKKLNILFDPSRYRSVKENKEVDSMAGFDKDDFGRFSLFFTINIDNTIWGLTDHGEPYLLECPQRHNEELT